MIVVYSMNCTGYDLAESLELVSSMSEEWVPIPEFASKLLQKVADHQDDIEQIIEPVLKNWRLERISPVEKAMLQLGCAEIHFFPDIPPRVTINEYIELAKRYANENAPSFVNGILDKLVQLKQKPDFQVLKAPKEAQVPPEGEL